MSTLKPRPEGMSAQGREVFRNFELQQTVALEDVYAAFEKAQGELLEEMGELVSRGADGPLNFSQIRKENERWAQDWIDEIVRGLVK